MREQIRCLGVVGAPSTGVHKHRSPVRRQVLRCELEQIYEMITDCGLVTITSAIMPGVTVRDGRYSISSDELS